MIRVPVTSWDDAERLTDDGVMSLADWEDWVDAALGQGGLWPGYVEVQEPVKASASAYSDYLRKRATAEFHYCNEHDCATHGNWAKNIGEVKHFGLENFPPKRREALLTRVGNLQRKYGVRVILDARPSEGAEVTGRDRHYNYSEETEALAAVLPGEAIIHVNPNMADDNWIKKELTRKSFIAKTVAEVITHEYAHALEGNLEEHSQWKTLGELREPFANAILDPAGFERSRLRQEVSFYASQDSHEAVAESFVLWEKGIHNQWSDHVGSIFSKEV